ncbi:MAG: hypothetical protein HYY46_09730 [Deltaproteobacteria bacterium]|nr:hypothetical protein [Deltaproteobacteria bacterium]
MPDKEKCPLCNSDATVRERPMGIDGKAVECVLCTTFEITENALSGLRSKPGDKELIPYLICHIRQAKKQSPLFNVASHTWRQFAQSHKNTPFSQKTARLLDLLATRSDFQPGGRIQLDSKLDWPLIDAGSEVEFAYLVDFLLEADYVNQKFRPLFQLTPKTWERFEEAATGQGTPGKCFIAMSFDESLNEAYDQGLYLALKNDCKMEPVRIDRVHHNEKICDKIVAEIRACQFIVADVTLQRAGVYFEAGFAMGLGRPVIWTCREDDLDNVHFDTRQYNHIVWKEPGGLRTQLADRIKATIPGAV